MNQANFFMEVLEINKLHPNLKMHPDVIGEMKDIVLGSGYEADFIKQLKKQLAFADDMGPQVVELSTFEVLKSADGLYSMHIKSSKYNIRILYSITDSGQLLLHCFYKRSGKKQTDYARSIPIALRRKNELEVLS